MKKQIQKSNNMPDLTVRYNKMSFFQSLFGPVVLIILQTIVIILRPFHSSFAIMYVLCLFAILLIYLCYRFSYIKIFNGLMVYNRLIEGKIEIALKDIKEAVYEVGADGLKPFIRLTIVPKPSTGMEEFYINSYNYEPKGLRQLEKLLPMKRKKSKGIIENWVNTTLNYSEKRRKSIAKKD